MELDGFELPDDLSPLISKISEDAVDQGGFGDVYKCCLSYNTNVNVCTRKPGISQLMIGNKVDVAVKVLRILPHDEGSKKEVRREMGIWRRARHKHIVPFFGVANNFMPSRISLVSAWQTNGTLTSLLDRKHDMDYKERFLLLLDIASGLGYLHSVGIVHGDLTGSNVLINVDGHARLTDFGLSSIVNAGEDLTYLAITTRRPGALRWAAPELVVKDNDHIAPTFGSDIYSFGSIMLQTLSGRLPWSEIKNLHCITIKLYEECLPQRPESLPMLDAHWDFIMLCMNLVVESRPSAAEVMEWVKEAVLLLGGRAGAETGGSQRFTVHLNNYLQVTFGAAVRRHVRWEVASAGPQNAITWYCTVYIDDEEYGVGVGHTMGTSRDAAARHALETLERDNDHSESRMDGHMVCQWDDGNGLCSMTVTVRTEKIMAHLVLYHLKSNMSGNIPEQCLWIGCGRLTRRDTIFRHIREAHFGLRRCTSVDDKVYGVGVGHIMGASRDAVARHALETLERKGLTIPRSRTAQTFPYGGSDTREQPPDSTLTHPDRSACATNTIHTIRHALETLERKGLTIPRSSVVQTFPYGRLDTREQPTSNNTPDRGTCATNTIDTLFEAHPRTTLNYVLLLMFGTSLSNPVRWEVISTGTTLAPSWHATVYVDDMAYGTGEASTKGNAQDAAALNAWEILRRKGKAQESGCSGVEHMGDSHA